MKVACVCGVYADRMRQALTWIRVAAISSSDLQGGRIRRERCRWGDRRVIWLNAIRLSTVVIRTHRIELAVRKVVRRLVQQGQTTVSVGQQVLTAGDRQMRIALNGGIQIQKLICGSMARKKMLILKNGTKCKFLLVVARISNGHKQ